MGSIYATVSVIYVFFYLFTFICIFIFKVIFLYKFKTGALFFEKNFSLTVSAFYLGCLHHLLLVWLWT